MAPSTMEEQFALVDEFEDCLESDRARRDVRRWTAGLSLWHAIRSILAGDPRNAAAHVRVARRNGTAMWEMAYAFARLLLRRIWWKLRGPFVPGGAAPDAPLGTTPTPTPSGR